MKLHLPLLLRRSLYLLIGIPCVHEALSTAYADQIYFGDGCAYYQEYYRDSYDREDDIYYICVVSGGSVSGGGNVDYTAPSAARGAYGFRNTNISNGAGAVLSVCTQGKECYGISGSSLINSGSVGITTNATYSAYGIENTPISNEAGGSLTILSTSAGSSSSVYGITGLRTLGNSGVVEIMAEGGHIAWGISASSGDPSITNNAGGILTIQSHAYRAHGITGGAILTNSGTVNITANATSEDASGIEVATITNDAQGSITIQSCGGESVQGIRVSESLTNSGMVGITVESASGPATALSGGPITNNAGGNLTLRVHSISGTFDEKTYGINLGSANKHLTNHGIIDITSESGGYGYAYGIYTGTIFNEASGHMMVVARGSSSNAHGIASSFLYNRGIMDISADALDEDSAYGISTSGSNSVITNEAGGHLAIRSNGGWVAYGIQGSASITNEAACSLTIQSHGASSAYGIAATKLTNSGTVDIMAESVTDSVNGLSIATITNAENGIMTIQSRGGGRANGIYSIYGSLSNRGVLDITVESVNASATGIECIGSSLTNNVGGSMTLNVKGGGSGAAYDNDCSVYGISGSLTNSGMVSISAEAGDTRAYAIKGNISNKTGGSLILQSRNSTDSYYAAYGIHGSLTNSGVVDITAESTNSTAYGIYTDGVAVYTNEAGGSLTIRSSSHKSAYGIYVGGDDSLLNSGRLEAHAQADGTAHGLYLTSNSVAVNEQDAYLAASGSTAGVYIYYSGRLYNAGELKTDSILLDNSGAAYMLDGAVIGSYTQDSAMVISGKGTVFLGGERGEDNTVQGLTSGSRISTTSDVIAQANVKLSLKDDVTLNLGGNLTMETVSHNGHALTVDNGKSAHRVTMGSTVAAEWNGAVAVENGDGVLKLTSEGGNIMSNGTLAAEHITVTSAEDSEMVLQDMALKVTGSEMSLAHVAVQGNCSFASTSGALTLNVEGVTFVLDASNSSGMGMEPVAFFSVDPLTETAVAPSVFYIASDMLAGVNVVGNMTLNLSYWAEEIAAGGYENITLSFAEDMNLEEGTQVQATLNGVNFAMADYAGDNMVQFSVANLPTGAVPEPTSTTLSLLALTALAARRRRL